jgi:hypothetical protein
MSTPSPSADRNLLFAYQRPGIDVATTQFTDLAGRPQYLVGNHRHCRS